MPRKEKRKNYDDFPKEVRKAISAKVGYLISKEKKNADQAYAIAMDMAREGKLK